MLNVTVLTQFQVAVVSVVVRGYFHDQDPWG